MSKRLSALVAAAAAALFAVPAHATVVFNWVQTGTPHPTQNYFVPFVLGISDATWWAAQSAPTTFGVISTTSFFGDISTPGLAVNVGSADVVAQVQVNGYPGSFSGLTSVGEGLALCNAPNAPVFSCRARFSSTAVQPGSAFRNYLGWGGEHAERHSRYTFTLSGDGLAVDTWLGPFNVGTMQTDATGAGYAGWGADGVVIRSLGYWQVDPSTIPAVPLPPSAWLMALGLAGVALRTRRR